MQEIQKTTEEVDNHPCVFTPAGADQTFCERQTSVPQKAVRCTGCQSPWRICFACANKGASGRAINPKTGLCEEHGGVPEPDADFISEAEKALLGKLMGKTTTYEEIPIDLIRPRKDQPRTEFGDDVDGLAESMKLVGQLQPGIVIEIEPDKRGRCYELDDGERRFRAAKLAGLPSFKAIVLDDASSGLRFMRSVIANFNKEDHSLFEEMEMVLRMVEEFGYSQVAIAKSLQKSAVWVNQRYGLRRLHPKLKQLLKKGVPKEERLSLVPALRLAPLHHELQLDLLSEVRGKGQAELSHIMAKEVSRHGGVYIGTARKRDATDNFRSVARGIKTALGRLALINDSTEDMWYSALHTRSTSEIQGLKQQLDEITSHIKAIRDRLGE